MFESRDASRRKEENSRKKNQVMRLPRIAKGGGRKQRLAKKKTSLLFGEG